MRMIEINYTLFLFTLLIFPFMKRLIVKEIVIEVPRGYIRDLKEIENRRWEKFTTYLEAIVLSVVKEFYANAKERDGVYVFV